MLSLRAQEVTAPNGQRWIVDPRWVWRRAWKLRWRGKGSGHGEAVGDIADSGFDAFIWLPDFGSGLDFADELGLVILAIILIPLILAFIFFFVIPLVIFLVELVIWLLATALFVRVIELRNPDSDESYVVGLPLFAWPSRRARLLVREIENGQFDPRKQATAEPVR